jgi:hypothetical protein
MLARLPGVAQLATEQLVAVLCAVIQCQAELLRQEERQALGSCMLASKDRLWPPPATIADALLEALCCTGDSCQGVRSNRAAGTSSDSSSKKAVGGGLQQLSVASVQELLLLALKLRSWHAVQCLCRCSPAEELSAADAVSLLQQAAQAASVTMSLRGAKKASTAAVAAAVCSLPAVRCLDSDVLADVLQPMISSDSYKWLVEGLCQLPAAKQLTKTVVDRLAAAAAACGSAAVLQALCVLQDV